MKNVRAANSQQTDMRVGRRGRLLSARGARRCGIVAAALSAAVLLTSCMPYRPASAKTAEQLSTGDAVIAVRLKEGRSVSGLAGPTRDNWIGLLDAQGGAELGRVEDKSGGDIVWTASGISYGAPYHEYLTTAQGTQVIKRQRYEPSEQRRYALPDGRIAVVGSSTNWGYRVETVDLDGTFESVESNETSGAFGQCGSRILAITSTEDSKSIGEEAFATYSTLMGGDGERPDALSVVVQLNDHDGDVPTVVAVAPLVEGLGTAPSMFVCEGDVITVPSKQLDDPEADTSGGSGAQDGTLVIQRWDLSTGQRAIIPVHDEAGNAVTLEGDRSVVGARAVQVGNDYRFISGTGDAYTVDLVSGQGRLLFSIPSTKTDNEVLFQVTESGVYALEDREEDRLVALSYQSWDGGGKRDVFTTGTLEKYLRTNSGILSAGYRRGFESFALRPGWDGGAQ